MSLSYSENEDLVQKAIDDYNDLHYNVNPRRVQRRLKGHHSKNTRKPSHSRLNPAQEQSLCDYIKRLENIEHSIRLHYIRGAAEYILKTGSNPNHPPKSLGRDWVTRFLGRHPEYHKRKQKPLSAERKNAHDLQSIQEAYERFRQGVQEMGFRVGCGITHCVITLDKSKPLRFMDPDNRDYVTSVECISAAGWSVPPFVILKGAHILHKWGKNDLPPVGIQPSYRVP